MSYALIRYDKISSTNTYAKQLALLPSAVTVISAKEQTSGRGRQGKSWDSAKGLGLWISIVLEPELELSNLPTLTFVVANAVAFLLRKTFQLPAEIKWPNDVFVGDKKICGILSETYRAANGSKGSSGRSRVILGIGLNVAHRPQDFAEGLQATSINFELLQRDLATRITKPENVLTLLMDYFEQEYAVYAAESATNGESKTILNHWIAMNRTIGSRVEFTLDGQRKVGTAVGVTPEGHLLINSGEGSFVKVSSGEVTHLP